MQDLTNKQTENDVTKSRSFDHSVLLQMSSQNRTWSVHNLHGFALEKYYLVLWYTSCNLQHATIVLKITISSSESHDPSLLKVAVWKNDVFLLFFYCSLLRLWCLLLLFCCSVFYEFVYFFVDDMVGVFIFCQDLFQFFEF